MADLPKAGDFVSRRNQLWVMVRLIAYSLGELDNGGEVQAAKLRH